MTFFQIGNKNQNCSSINTSVRPLVRRRFVEYFLIPDSDIFWAIGSILKGLWILIKEKPQVILSSGPSHSAHILGLFLKKMSRKKWVIEFRDPWTMNPFNIPKPFTFLSKMDNYMEKIVLLNADRINVTSVEYKTQFLRKYKFINEEKIVQIPNGFDPEDFKMTNICQNKKFTIIHSGNFYQHRSSAIFIEAILYLFENRILEPSNIIVKFIGVLDDYGKSLILDSIYSESFEITGPVSHSRSIDEICKANLLLLIPGPGSGTMPGKFYEYLAASRPIFCIANEGPAKQVIEEHNLGIVSDETTTIEIAKRLYEIIENIISGKFMYPNVEELKVNFNRKKIAGRMANILFETRAE
jgi:glycosyltransferase involved in cell wall biosynthesis